MDRRILLLAEPAPLLSSDVSCGSCLDAISRSPYPQPSEIQIQDRDQDPRALVQQPKAVAQDLRHLRNVLDHLSLFCRAQQSLVAESDTLFSSTSSGTISALKTEAQRSGAKPMSDRYSRGGIQPQRSLSSSRPRVLLAAVFPCPPTEIVAACNRGSESEIVRGSSDASDNMSTELHRRSNVSTLMGAAATTTSNTALGVPHETVASTQRGRCSLELAKAFAGVLEDGCGAWLPPEEFEARVLTPTRALIDAQLGDSRMLLLRALPLATLPPGAVEPSRNETPTNAATPSAARDANAECRVFDGKGDDKRIVVSYTSSASSLLQPGLTAPTESLARDATTEVPGTAAQTASLSTAELESSQGKGKGREADIMGAFVRSAAEDMMLLLRETAIGSAAAWGRTEGIRGERFPYSEACRSVDLGGGGGGGRGRRLLVDVLWAAASLPVEDPLKGGKGRIIKEETLEASSAPACVTDAVSSAPATWEAVERSSSEPIDLDSGRSEKSSRGGAGLVRCPALTLSLPAADQEQAASLLEALRIVRHHSPESRVVIWPAAVNASSDEDDGTGVDEKIVVVEAPEIARSSPASERAVGDEWEIRRRWASWCGTTGARLFLGSPQTGEDSRGSGQLVEPVDPGLLWRGPIVGGSTSPPEATAVEKQPFSLPKTDFPALEGFALRVTPVSSPLPGGGDSRGVIGLARSAASILSRAPALRLNRVISPSEAARSCHLFADGASAPALELSVFDRERFPGSAAFLDECAATRRGLLLVAVAPRTTAAVGMAKGEARNHFSAEAGEKEGLAMACFPFLRRRPSGRKHRAASWSVTLFRGPSEFSKEAVNALVGETFDSNPPPLQPLPPRSPSMGGRALESTPSAAEDRKLRGLLGRRDGSIIHAAIASLPVYTASSLCSEVRRFLVEAKNPPLPRKPPADSLEGGVAIAPGEAGGRDETKAFKSKTRTTASSRNRRGVEPWSSASAEGKAEEATIPTPTSTALLSVTKKRRVISALESWAARLHSGVFAPVETAKEPGGNAAGGDCGYCDPATRDDPKPRGPGSAPGAKFAARAIYASLGAWQSPGGRLSWAEEALLSGARPTSASGSNGVVIAGRRFSPPRGGFPGGKRDPLETRAEASYAPRFESGAQGAAERAGAEAGVAGGAPAAPRTLSTAEQALEKAGSKQRARKKERRMVAREQRARIDRPHPRPRHRPASSSVAVGSSAGRGVVGGIYRRGGSLSSLPSPGAGAGAGALGRSVQGSKLCRGSLILGRSVGVGVDVEGGAVVNAAPMTKASGKSAVTVADGEAFRECVGHSAGRRAAANRRGAISGLREAAKEPPVEVRGTYPARCHRENRPVRRAIFADEGPTSAAQTVSSGVGVGADNCGYKRDDGQRSAAGGSGGGVVRQPGEAGRKRVAAVTTGGNREGGSAPAGIPGPVGADGGAAERGAAGDDSAAVRGSDGLAEGGHSTMQRVMERAMLAAIAAQMGLPEGDPHVREVFERESRRMVGAGGSSC